MDDRQIVELYLSRDEQAIAETITKYGSALHTLSYRIVQNDADADECTNDTYAKTWNSIPPHTPYTYLFAYLARIIRQISLNLVKHNSRQKRNATLVSLSEELSDCLSPDGADTEYDDHQIAASISAFLRSLPPRHGRSLFVATGTWIPSPKSVGISDIQKARLPPCSSGRAVLYGKI